MVQRYKKLLKQKMIQVLRLKKDVDILEIEIHKEDFDLGGLVHQCVDKLRIKAEQLKVDIIII